MEIIKAIGRSGQVSLGKKYAGRTVLIDQIDPGVWIIKLGEFVPENERWLHQAGNQEELREAIAWAEKHPPRKSNLKALEARLKK